MAIQDKFNRANVIYKITKDIDLGGETLTIPEGCTLDFQGGSFSNGTIVGNNTSINAPLVKLFNLDVELNGEFNLVQFYPEWFGAKGDGETDDAIFINKTINIKANAQLNVALGDKTYLVSPDVIEFKRHNVRLFGNNSKIVTNYNEKDKHYKAILSGIPNYCSDITVEGITFDNTGDDVSLPESLITSDGSHAIISISCNNLLVRNNTIYFYGIHAINSVSYSSNVRVENNSLFFSRKGGKYDCSALYINNRHQTISGNYINGKYNTEEEYLWGGIESHGDEYSVVNNTIENCLKAINVTNHDNYMNERVDTSGLENKIVSNNGINNCTHGIIIWSLPGSNPIANLLISNNALNLDNTGGNGIGSATEGDMKNITICNNMIQRAEGKPSYPYNSDYAGIINFTYGSLDGLFIYGNTIVNAARAAVFIHNDSSTKVIKNVDIKSNRFIDCGVTVHNGETPLMPYKGYSVIYAKNAEHFIIKDNSFLFNKSISYLENLVCLDGDYTYAEILQNQIKCYYTDNSENYKEDIEKCHFDLKKVKTDLRAYVDNVSINNREYKEKTYITSSESIPNGNYHKGDKLIKSNGVVLFKDSYKIGATIAGFMPIDWGNGKIFSIYPSALPNVNVGDVLSFSSTIGGVAVKHTVSKILGTSLTFAEDIVLTDSAMNANSSGYKGEITNIPIG